MKKQPSKYRIGDMVWCYHVKGERLKGIILHCLSNHRYTVKVFLPKTRDERGRVYIMNEILFEKELEPMTAANSNDGERL